MNDTNLIQQYRVPNRIHRLTTRRSHLGNRQRHRSARLLGLHHLPLALLQQRLELSIPTNSEQLGLRQHRQSIQRQQSHKQIERIPARSYQVRELFDGQFPSISTFTIVPKYNAHIEAHYLPPFSPIFTHITSLSSRRSALCRNTEAQAANDMTDLPPNNLRPQPIRSRIRHHPRCLRVAFARKAKSTLDRRVFIQIHPSTQNLGTHSRIRCRTPSCIC